MARELLGAAVEPRQRHGRDESDHADRRPESRVLQHEGQQGEPQGGERGEQRRVAPERAQQALAQRPMRRLVPRRHRVRERGHGESHQRRRQQAHGARHDAEAHPVTGRGDELGERQAAVVERHHPRQPRRAQQPSPALGEDVPGLGGRRRRCAQHPGREPGDREQGRQQHYSEREQGACQIAPAVAEPDAEPSLRSLVERSAQLHARRRLLVRRAPGQVHLAEGRAGVEHREIQFPVPLCLERGHEGRKIELDPRHEPMAFRPPGQRAPQLPPVTVRPPGRGNRALRLSRVERGTQRLGIGGTRRQRE